MNIYVGNLAWKTKRKELKELFENFGEVTNAFIVRDRKTRRSRGFGFVEMSEDEEAQVAIEKLNNTVFLERTIIVNEARPKDENDSDEEDSGESYTDDSDENEAVDAGESSNNPNTDVASDDESPQTQNAASGESLEEDSVKNR